MKNVVACEALKHPDAAPSLLSIAEELYVEVERPATNESAN